MISINRAKDYLRIPYKEDDGYIVSAISQGYSYIRDAVDDFDEIYAKDSVFSDKCDMWVLTQWMPSAYDRREGMFTGVVTMDYTARAMLTQLQMYRKEE